MACVCVQSKWHAGYGNESITKAFVSEKMYSVQGRHSPYAEYAEHVGPQAIGGPLN